MLQLVHLPITQSLWGPVAPGLGEELGSIALMCGRPEVSLGGGVLP